MRCRVMHNTTSRLLNGFAWNLFGVWTLHVGMTTHIDKTAAQQRKPNLRFDGPTINSFLMKSMLKPIVFVLLSAPFIWLVYALLSNQLGANPIEAITDFTGVWALRILLLSLAMTPLRMLVRKPWPIRLRRMIGLFAFFYVLTHLATYLVLDQQLDVVAILSDILERPYITAGSLALIILVPLAATSTKRMMKRLGKRWTALHRLVYLAATAAIVHYIWQTRGDQLEPLIYLVVLFVLMLFRVKRLVSQ